MAESLFNKVYNPDVLSCLANLSNDEVFTPPEIVNQMLDMLPQELFKNPDTTFLDPACKTGVFCGRSQSGSSKGWSRNSPICRSASTTSSTNSSSASPLRNLQAFYRGAVFIAVNTQTANFRSAVLILPKGISAINVFRTHGKTADVSIAAQAKKNTTAAKR